MGQQLAVVIADDHRIFAEALKEALENAQLARIVGLATNGREAVRMARDLRPDVILLDITMPELNGIEAAREIEKISPATKVIALSMHSDRRYVSAMLSARVAGYLVKECALEELSRALQTVASGQVYLSPLITGIVVEGFREGIEGGTTAPAGPLTAREREVLQLLAEDHRVADIAGRLHLSVKTVEAHRRQIMQKLGIGTVAGLTKYAILEGLTTLEE